MKESKFQKKVIDRIKNVFYGCIVLKNDPNYIQGIPDLIVLYRNKWAALEIKESKFAKHRPNQDYYINRLKEMGGFAEFVYPENFDFIFSELADYFQMGV